MEKPPTALPRHDPMAGAGPHRRLDAVFVSAPLRGAGSGPRRVIDTMMAEFTAVGDWAVWGATGRVNVLDRISDAALERGCPPPSQARDGWRGKVRFAELRVALGDEGAIAELAKLSEQEAPE